MKPLARATPATVDVLRVLLEEQGIWGMLVIKRTGRPAGSVYPILERLERFGWVTSSWEPDSERSGPRRRHYELTRDGVEEARAVVSRLDEAARAARATQAARALVPGGRAAAGGRVAGATAGAGA